MLAKSGGRHYTLVHKVSLRGWVQFPTGGDVWQHTSPRPAMTALQLNRCDSDTNSTVWMEEEHVKSRQCAHTCSADSVIMRIGPGHAEILQECLRTGAFLCEALSLRY